jgi:hypothetical protein
VHALYARNHIVTTVLSTLFVVENSIMIFSCIGIIRAVQFDAACAVTHTSFDLLWFACAPHLLGGRPHDC